MDKILRKLEKVTRLNFQHYVFSLAKSRYFVIIAFNMLKTEFRFEYARLI